MTGFPSERMLLRLSPAPRVLPFTFTFLYSFIYSIAVARAPPPDEEQCAEGWGYRGEWEKSRTTLLLLLDMTDAEGPAWIEAVSMRPGPERRSGARGHWGHHPSCSPAGVPTCLCFPCDILFHVLSRESTPPGLHGLHGLQQRKHLNLCAQNLPEALRRSRPTAVLALTTWTLPRCFSVCPEQRAV